MKKTPFSISIPNYRRNPNYLEGILIDKSKKLLKLESEKILNYMYKKLEKEVIKKVFP